jgi:hypothetical protein
VVALTGHHHRRSSIGFRFIYSCEFTIWASLFGARVPARQAQLSKVAIWEADLEITGSDVVGSGVAQRWKTRLRVSWGFLVVCTQSPGQVRDTGHRHFREFKIQIPSFIENLHGRRTWIKFAATPSGLPTLLFSLRKARFCQVIGGVLSYIDTTAHTQAASSACLTSRSLPSLGCGLVDI